MRLSHFKQWMAPLFVWAGVCLAGDLVTENTRPVEFGEGKSKQTFDRLVIGELPGLATSIIYPKRGVQFQGSKGLVLVYPGTSAKVNTDAGAERSLAPIANEIIKRGYSVIAFQPPIYYKSDSPEDRVPYLEKYGELEGNLVWFMETIRMALEFSKSQKGEDLPLFVAARSTFAAVSLEAHHRYLRGEGDFSDIGKLRRLVAMGLYGHSAEQIDEWHNAEKEFYFIQQPDRGDKPVIEAAPVIFSKMTHQQEDITESQVGNRPIPPVITTLGSRDEFAEGKLPSLFLPVVSYAARHPGVPITLAWHDGHHNPAREIRDRENHRIANPMARMKLVLDLLFDETVKVPPGFYVRYLPAEGEVLQPLKHDEVVSCKKLLSSIGQH